MKLDWGGYISIIPVVLLGCDILLCTVHAGTSVLQQSGDVFVVGAGRGQLKPYIRELPEAAWNQPAIMFDAITGQWRRRTPNWFESLD